MPITNFVTTIASSAIRIFEFLLFARAILSWFPATDRNPLTDFLHFATEPILIPFREILGKIGFLRGLPIDFSVLFAFIVLEFLQYLLYLL